MIRVLVVDDHTVVRDSLCRLLNGEPDIVVVGQAGSSAQAVRACAKLEPDVVLLDYNLPDGNGLGTTGAIVRLGSRSRVLILTMHASHEYAIRAIRTGALGFVVKTASSVELLAAVHEVAAGGVYVSQTVLHGLADRNMRQ